MKRYSQDYALTIYLKESDGSTNGVSGGSTALSAPAESKSKQASWYDQFEPLNALPRGESQLVKNTALALASQTESFAKTAIQMQLQHISIETGSQQLQQRQETMLNIVGGAKNAVSGLATSFAMFGVPGAIVTAAFTAISTATAIATKQHELNLQRDVEEYALNRMRDRAGSTFNRSRNSYE